MDSLQAKAHFGRRAAGGATLEELNNSITPQKWLQEMLNNITPNSLPQLPGLPSNQPEPQLLDDIRQEFVYLLLNQLVNATNPLHERIVNFWRDYFVISMRKTSIPYALADYEQRLRRFAFGDFKDLLFQVTVSPAMLNFLDGRQNRRGNINENYSREVMELFTIGRGNYNETDVQEGARALTGWVIENNFQRGTSTSTFNPGQHDNGSKNFLGMSGNFQTEDIVEILANHPQTGRNLGARLWSTFVYPNPEPQIIDRLASVYRESNRSIARMVETIFTSPEFYSPRAYRSRIRSPQEFMTGSLRQLQVKTEGRRVANALRSMGQSLYNPPTVRGWTTNEGWLTAPSLLNRLNVARQIALNNDNGFELDEKLFTKESLITLLLDNQAFNIPDSQGLSTRQFATLLLSSPPYQLA